MKLKILKKEIINNLLVDIYEKVLMKRNIYTGGPIYERRNGKN